jgi:hypothetical protein
MTLPNDTADLISQLVIGNPAVVSPGVVVLSGHDRNEDWDVQAAKGSTGASSKLNGKPIARFTATFYLAGDGEDEVDDFEKWEGFQPVLESMVNGPAAVAYPVYHPDLARQRITEVSVESIGGLSYDGKGGASVVVKFIEYRPPKAKPVAKAQAKAGSRGGNSAALANDPNAAAKRELAGLVEQAKQP